MATETVPAAEHTITERRHHLAAKAHDEIGQVVRLLRDELAKLNREASVPMLFGVGLLQRIEKLSDAASECIGVGDDWDDEALGRIIEQGGAA